MKSFLALLFTIIFFQLAQAQVRDGLHTYYVHLEGHAPGVPQDAVLKKFHTVFLDPLGMSGKKTYNSYATQVQGANNYFVFNFIFEAINDSQINQVEQFVADREGLIVLGNKVSFKKVTLVKEIASFLIGSYDGALEDAFVLKYSYPRNFEFKNLSEWLTFSNEFGYTLLASHDKFKNYVNSFIKDAPEQAKMTALLAQNDMAAIESDISFVLENGEVVSQDFTVSPFTLWRFFRSCYMPQYENGKCF